VPRGGGLATLIVAADRAALAGSEIPGLPEGRTYQPWIIRGKRLTSAGLWPGAADGR
jgi:hypothetical protein